MLDGVPYAFAVSLDHRLRVWNLSTGRIAYIGDILSQEPESSDAAKPFIDPSQSQLVRVYSDSDEMAFCATYSPLGTGQFKFWNVTPTPDGTLEVADLFPESTLVPRSPGDLWTLADFCVVPDRTNIDRFSIWTLWKNNTAYQVQCLDFKTGANATRVQDTWSNGWACMATETLDEAPLPSAFPGDPADVTDKWLGFILFPGKFSRATVETGLAIYERGLGVSKDATRRSDPLPERLSSLVASTASLGRRSDGHIDYQQFRAATDAQWRRFYRLLLELDKQRGEALSLIIDPEGEMPWVISSDRVSAIRACSSFERIWHNPDSVQAGTEHLATLVSAAAALRDAFSDQVLHSSRTALLEELFEEPSHVGPTRMKAFYDKCGLADHISDEDYAQLVSNLGGGFKNVTPQVYEALEEVMVINEDVEKR